MVQESQSSGLASHRAIAKTGEAVIVLVGVSTEISYDSSADSLMIISYLSEQECPEFSGVGMMLGSECPR